MSSALDYSQITEYLYISAWPLGDHLEEITGLNIGLILSMHYRRPSKALDTPPVRLLWLPTFDNPLTPIPMRTLRRGVKAALAVIDEGYSVLSHCIAGRHRSVAMACSVLIAKGFTADEAIRLVKERRPAADPEAWYIRRRIRKFEADWNQRLSASADM